MASNFDKNEKKKKKYRKNITKNTEFDTLIFAAVWLFPIYLNVQIQFS